MNGRDAHYFLFDVEPLPGTTLPFRLDDLPRRTSPERALVGLWQQGGHSHQVRGVIPVGHVRAPRL